MKRLKLIVQFIFYLLVFLLLLSRAVTAVFSHDENQFVAAGGLLVDHGLLPYLNYPYTHMPYSAAFYAATAALSNYDFLAARILTAVVWFVCTLLIIAASRLMLAKISARSEVRPSFAQVFWEFVIVYVFLYHPVSAYVLSAALNHSFSTLFSLLALLLFLRGSQAEVLPTRTPLYSGIFICLAALTRFNYASLVVVLLPMWVIYGLIKRSSLLSGIVIPFLAGLFTAGIPLLSLIAVAPNGFYYANLVYTRLNTIYYQELLYRSNMSLGSKISSFIDSVIHSPLDVLLYVVLIYVSIAALRAFIARKLLPDLNKLAIAGFAGALWLTAFAPTPTLGHYFFAPLPFMLIILTVLGMEIYTRNRVAYALIVLGVLFTLIATVKIPSPIVQLARLSNPSQWTPVQVHDFAQLFKRYLPRGKILTLSPVVPLEAGYDIYPFTASGPFIWRTSLLLTPQGRARYNVVSPEELPQLLAESSPDAILTGFEAPNAGFDRKDLGGLETPFTDYAVEHGYLPVSLSPPFLEHNLILWIRPGTYYP